MQYTRHNATAERQFIIIIIIIYSLRTHPQIFFSKSPFPVYDAYIHRVSQKKRSQLIFCSGSVKHELISVKIGRNVKSPLHLKYVLALPWEIRSV